MVCLVCRSLNSRQKEERKNDCKVGARGNVLSVGGPYRTYDDCLLVVKQHRGMR